MGDINPRVDLHLEVNSVQVTGVSRPRILSPTDNGKPRCASSTAHPDGVTLDLMKGQRVHLTGVMPRLDEEVD